MVSHGLVEIDSLRVYISEEELINCTNSEGHYIRVNARDLFSRVLC